MKLFLALFLCVFISQVLYGQPAGLPSPHDLKILSWNIYMLPGWPAFGNNQRAVAIGRYLAESDYDVIVFQEAFCPISRRTLNNLLSSKFLHQAGPANRRTFSLKINSGIWILSRYPIISAHSIKFKNKQGIDALSRKGALLVEIDIAGQIVQIAGTHLQNSGDPMLRHLQCVEVYDRLLKPNEKSGTPQIICGDFNIDKNHSAESYAFMLRTLNASDGELDGIQKFTYDRMTNDLEVEKGTGQELIDYILVRENGGQADCHYRKVSVIKRKWSERHEDLSDHYAMEASITLSNRIETLSRNQSRP